MKKDLSPPVVIISIVVVVVLLVIGYLRFGNRLDVPGPISPETARLLQERAGKPPNRSSKNPLQ
jgi:hypothetical protein